MEEIRLTSLGQTFVDRAQERAFRETRRVSDTIRFAIVSVPMLAVGLAGIFTVDVGYDPESGGIVLSAIFRFIGIVAVILLPLLRWRFPSWHLQATISDVLCVCLAVSLVAITWLRSDLGTASSTIGTSFGGFIFFALLFTMILPMSIRAQIAAIILIGLGWTIWGLDVGWSGTPRGLTFIAMFGISGIYFSRQLKKQSSLAFALLERAERLALFDTLTGLPNRRLLLDRFGRDTATVDRAREKVALAMVDLDQFKVINDRFGHNFGDHVLVEAARRLNAHVRSVDTVSRYGGDEFVILFVGVESRDDVVVPLERIIDDFMRPLELEGQRIDQVRASIGVSFYPDDGSTFDDLVAKADSAMYQAKNHDGSEFRFYGT